MVKVTGFPKESQVFLLYIVSSVSFAYSNASEEVIKSQGEAVKNTTVSYQNINRNIEKLMKRLDDITENVRNIEEERISTLGAIENISAVLEEMAASLFFTIMQRMLFILSSLCDLLDDRLAS